MLLLDSSKNVLKLIIGQILKQGKKTKILNLFVFFLFNFYQLFNFLIGDELELLIEKDFNLPYSLGKKHLSNRTYYFPRPIKEKANWKFFFKSFAKNFKKEQHGQAIYSLLIKEIVNLIFCNSDIFIFKEIDYFLKHAHEYRMFIHFRWTKRKVKKLPRRIRFKRKKVHRRKFWTYKILHLHKFYKAGRLYVKPKSRHQKLIRFFPTGPYKLY
jgi:hypothetical protein